MADQHRMPTHHPRIIGTRHMVSSANYLAAQVGFEILEAGGNAIDAGVAGGIALGVLQCEYVHFAGVAPIMIRLAETGETVSISGLGPWPKLASAAWFREHQGGRILSNIKRTVVPAAPDAWITALERYGTMSFAEVAAAAIRFGREGFGLQSISHEVMTEAADTIRRYPQNAAIYMPGGDVPQPGARFFQTDLANSIQYMADEEAAASRKGGRAAGLAAARDAFYRGDIAQKIVAYHKANDGWLREDDLAEFRVDVETPLNVRFGDVTVFGCRPWCQGPVLLQTLKILDGIDLRSLGHNTPAYIHTLVEALKLAFADRHAYYGDPKFVDVPIDALLSDAYSRATACADQAGPRLPGNATCRHCAGAWDRGAHIRCREGGSRICRGRPGYVVCLRGRSPWQLLLCHAKRWCDQRTGDPWHGPRTFVARHAVLDRSGASRVPRAGQAAEAHAQPVDRDARRQMDHAVRFAGKRCAATGDAPGVPQHGGVRHDAATGDRAAALRLVQLPRFVRSA